MVNQLHFADIDRVIDYLHGAGYINKHFAALQRMSLRSGGPVFHDIKKYYKVNRIENLYEIKPEYIKQYSPGIQEPARHDQ